MVTEFITVFLQRLHIKIKSKKITFRYTFFFLDYQHIIEMRAGILLGSINFQ